MNNIFSFSQFLNEGWLFKSPDDDLINKVIQKIEKNFDVTKLKKDYVYGYGYTFKTLIHERDGCIYSYILKKGSTEEIDPYHEEEWEDSDGKDAINVSVTKYRGADYLHYSSGTDMKPNPNPFDEEFRERGEVKINDVSLDISNSKFDKLWNIFSKPERDRIKLEKEEEDRLEKEAEQKIKNKKNELIKKLNTEL